MRLPRGGHGEYTAYLSHIVIDVLPRANPNWQLWLINYLLPVRVISGEGKQCNANVARDVLCSVGSRGRVGGRDFSEKVR